MSECGNGTGLFNIDYCNEVGWQQFLTGDTILLALILVVVIAVVIWVICFVCLLVKRIAKRRQVEKSVDTIEGVLITEVDDEKSKEGDTGDHFVSKQQVQENVNTIQEDPVEGMYDLVTDTTKNAIIANNTSGQSPPPAPPPPAIVQSTTMVYAVVNKKSKRAISTEPENPKIRSPGSHSYDNVIMKEQDNYDVLNREYSNPAGGAATSSQLATTTFYDVVGEDQQVTSVTYNKLNGNNKPTPFQDDSMGNYDMVNL